ncbi:MAG: hypothetical protein HC888_13635, partial [Candidatus Competibacteraceae bacterium]|nr:hypothetical protein [Candidatus Competibacteraceae bacterium]
MLAPGDRIAITLFEPVGGGLFGGGPIADGGPMRALPPQVVDARGRIRVPYAGEIAVEGLDPTAAPTGSKRRSTRRSSRRVTSRPLVG